MCTQEHNEIRENHDAHMHGYTAALIFMLRVMFVGLSVTQVTRWRKQCPDNNGAYVESGGRHRR